jgi:hypothetical protein
MHGLIFDRLEVADIDNNVTVAVNFYDVESPTAL